MNWESAFHHQLTHGCDCFQCKNKYCAKCPEFVYKGKTPAQIEDVVRIFSGRGDRMQFLCPFLPINVLYFDVNERLAHLNEWARRLIDTGHPDPEEVRAKFTENRALIPLLCLSNSAPLSIQNSGIDDDFFYDFSSKLSVIDELVPFFDEFIQTALNELQKDNLYRFSRVRMYMFLLYFPAILAKPEVLARALMFLATPFQLLKQTFNQWFAPAPHCMAMALGAARLFITNYFAANRRGNPRGKEVKMALMAMETLFLANEHAVQRLPTSRFYIHHLSERIDIVKEFVRKRDSLLEYPFIFPLEKKAEICELESRQMMGSMAMRAVFSGIRAALFERRDVQFDLFFTIHIRRDHLLEDAMRELSHQNESSFLKKLKVEFEGEVALDVGGPSREFLYLVSEQLLAPEFGMFKVINDRHLWFLPGSFEDSASFMLVGIVIGLAVYNSIVLPIRFPLCLYKKLLTPDKPLTLSDLADIDEEVANSLRDIERMKLADEDISSLCLNFAITVDQFGEPITHELCPNGENIDVTNENCDDYIAAYVNFILNTSIRRQFEAFARGFHLPIRASSYHYLSPCELDILVSGNDVLEWRQLKKNAQYSDGYTPESRAVVWFWEVFDDLSEEDKRKFLKFSTGTDRAPFGGLNNVSIVIQRIESSGQLPVSHTCFNVFVLPDYQTKEELSHKVRTAIQYTEGFGMI